MTTKHLISLLSRHEHLKTPANFRRLAARIAEEMVSSEFNPRLAERLLEVTPWNLRPSVAEQVVLQVQLACRHHGIKEPKGGISSRIGRVLQRIHENAEKAQGEFDAAMNAHSKEMANEIPDLRRRA
jgi:hypothetical protein